MTGAHARLEPAYLDEYEIERESEQAPRRRRGADPAVLVTVVALVVLAASLAHVAQRAKMAVLAYELHNATARLEELKRIHTRLTVEVEEARSLRRIEESARQLGMVRPTSTAWLVLDPARRESELEPGRDRTGHPWGGALAQWYDRVRSSIQAALPLSFREPER